MSDIFGIGEVGGAAIGAGAQIASAQIAADAQRHGADVASQTQRDFYASNKGMLQPWNDMGFKAYGTLNDLLGIGGNSATMQSTLEGLPGYQFTRDQGLKATQGGYAARGLGSSGGALKGAANYATGLANSQYGMYAGQLSGVAGQGLSAASSLAGVGQQTGAGIAAAQIGAGNASAAGWNATGNAIQGGINAYSQNQLLRSVMNNSATNGGGWSAADQQAWAGGV
jgi:hypothetical protein